MLEKETKSMRLIKDTVMYGLGNIGSKLLVFILIPIYTRYLSTEDYGYYDIIITTLSLLYPIITLQLADGVYRKIITETDNNIRYNIIHKSTKVLILNLFIFSLIYVLIINIFYIKYSFIILLLVYFKFVFIYLQQIFRGLNEIKLYSLIALIVTIATFILNLVFVELSILNVYTIILSLVISHVIGIGCFLLKIKKYRSLKKYEKTIKIKDLLIYSIPLIPNSINWWIINASDRYLVSYYLGFESNGVYAASYYLPSIFMVLISIFNMAWQDLSIKEYKSNNADVLFSKILDKYIKILIPSVILMISLSNFFVPFLLGSNFENSWKYSHFLFVGLIFFALSSFYGVAYQGEQKTKGAFYTSVLGSVINIILNILLIPLMGIQGAALSTMISFLSVFLIRFIDTKKYIVINIKIAELTKLMIYMAIVIFLSNSNHIGLQIFSVFVASIILIFYIKEVRLFTIIINKLFPTYKK